MVQDYYIERTYCRTTTKKEKALALMLKGYHYTLVHFSKSFTKDDLISQLKEQLHHVNMISHGRDIGLVVHDYNGIITIAFHPVPSNGDAMVTMAMHPVRSYLKSKHTRKKISNYESKSKKTERKSRAAYQGTRI